jgi:hypothetical protein
VNPLRRLIASKSRLCRALLSLPFVLAPVQGATGADVQSAPPAASSTVPGTQGDKLGPSAAPRVELLPQEGAEDWLLLIDAPGHWPLDALNIQPLLRQLAVGRISRQVSMGESGPQTRWLIPLHGRADSLPALKLGPWHIPPLAFPGKSLNQTSVADPEPRVVLRASIDHQGPLYPGQPFIYELRLWLPDQIMDPSLNEPEHPDLTIRRLGDDEWHPAARPGESGVLTRRWLLQARSPGQFTLMAPRLQANYQLDGHAEPLSGRAAPTIIQVDKAPLPLVARRLTLSQQFTPAQSVALGEPIIRTLRLRLEDGDGNRVAIPAPQVAGLKVLGDGGDRHERFLANGRLLFEQEWRQALRAQTPGVYLLPEIQLPWFNTQTGREERLTLAATPLSFTPSPADQPDTQPPRPTRLGPFSLLGWTLLALLLTGSLRRQTRWRAFYALQIAFCQADPDASRHALLHWAKLRWPPPRHPAITWLRDMPLDPALAARLYTLEAACFGTLTHFDGAALALGLCAYETPGVATLLRRVAWLNDTHHHKEAH